MKIWSALPESRIWKELSFTGKIRYLWDYYKLPFAAALFLLYFMGFFVIRSLNHQKPVLYAAMVNVAASQELEENLTSRYLDARLIDQDRNPMLLYRNLYLTDDPSSEVYTYVQASQMKILGTIEAREMDIVFMDKEAFDAFAQNGFLYDLDALLEEGREEHPELRQKTAAHLVRNMEIREDNAKEVALDPSVEYQSVTVEYEMGIDLLSSPFFRDSGFTESVYLGVLRNTPRKQQVLDYIEYLYQ